MKFTKATIRQVLCVSSVYSTSFISGMETAWSGPALKILTSFDSPIPINNTDVSWLAFATTLGDLMTILLCGIIFRNVGRKTLTQCSAIFLVFSWLLNAMAASFSELLISQFLVNAAIGIHDVSYCVYVSEVASAKNRSVFIALFLLCFTFGIESMYLIGIFNNYNYLNMFPLIASVISLVFCVYAVESPYYLLTKNKTDEAWKSLSFLHANEDFYQIAQEYEELRQVVQEHSADDNSFKFLLSIENYKMCLSACVIYVIVYTNSAFLFFSYVPIVFEQFGNLDFHFIMNSVGFMNIASVLVSPFFVEKFGRRSLMLVGFSSVALIQLFIGVGFYLDSFSDYSPEYLSLGVLLAALLDIAVFVTIVHPTSHVLKSEMLPIRLRNSGSCVMEVLKVITQGVVASTFIVNASMFGMGFNFLIYSAAAFYGTYFVYARLKETRGKTLCEIKNDYAQF